jgi:hypothetical protein
MQEKEIFRHRDAGLSSWADGSVVRGMPGLEGFTGDICSHHCSCEGVKDNEPLLSSGAYNLFGGIHGPYERGFVMLADGFEWHSSLYVADCDQSTQRHRVPLFHPQS